MRLRLYLILGLVSLRSVFGLDPTGSIIISGSQMNLAGQGWGTYSGNDAPEGAFIHQLNTGAPTFPATISLGQTLPTGTYSVFVKVVSYNQVIGTPYSKTQATLSGVSVERDNNDRDYGGSVWTKLPGFTIATPATSIALLFTKLSAVSAVNVLLKGLCIIPDPTNTVDVDARDRAMQIDKPYQQANPDNSTAVKGNLIGNSGFEAGISQGWGLQTAGALPAADRIYSLQQHLATVTPRTGGTGTKALKFTAMGTGVIQQMFSAPFTLKPNKLYSLSGYVKSEGTNTVWLDIVNIVGVPSGFPPVDLYTIPSTQSNTGPSWTRLSLNNVRVLAYPSDQWMLRLATQVGTGGTAVYFDDLQLEEGALTAHEFKNTIDINVSVPRADSLFYSTDMTGGLLKVSNNTGSTVSTTVKSQIWDTFLNSIRTDDISVSVGANSSTTYAIPLDPAPKFGAFRGSVWTESVKSDECEYLFSVLHPPSGTALDNTSSIGSHIDFTDWQMDANQFAGIKWSRNNSNGAIYRWNIAEPSDDSFVWYDAYPPRAINNGTTLLAPLVPDIPTWAARTFFVMGTPTGTFQVGETVTSSGGATGIISVILSGSSPTGWALQLRNVTGTFAAAAVVTGGTSGATATITVGSTVYAATPDLVKWADFCGSVVNHYKTDVHWWEIGNEPNAASTTIPRTAADNGNGGAAFYAELLTRSITAIKAADATANIVGLGGVADAAWGKRCVALLPGSWTTDVAALSFHIYPNTVGEAVTAAAIMAATEFAGKPIFNTETGPRDNGGYMGVSANMFSYGFNVFAYRDTNRFYLGLVTNPALVAQNYVRTMGAGISKYYYYDGRNTVSWPGFLDNQWSLVDYNEGFRPKGVVLANLAYLLDHSTGTGAVTTSDSTNTDAYVFSRSGVPTAAILTLNGSHKTINLNGNLSGGSIAVYDHMGSPVTVTANLVHYSRFPAFIVGTGMSVAQLKAGITASTIAAVTDVIAPKATITVAPRNPLPLGSDVYCRWLAIDDVSLPDVVVPNDITYSYKLTGVDSAFTSYSPVSFHTYTALAAGTYILEVKAKDAAGNISSTATRTFVVGAATDAVPILQITSPTTGSTFLSTDTVPFTGTAVDSEDGTISANIVWSSNLDGALGTGASISHTLSVGSHTITASITDAGAHTVTAQVSSLTIEAPPANLRYPNRRRMRMR